MVALGLLYEEDLHYQEMDAYLDSEDGYWKKKDVWHAGDKAFQKAGIAVTGKKRTIADFESFHSEKLKTEIKYYLLNSLKEKRLTAIGFSQNYLRALRLLGELTKRQSIESFRNFSNKGLELAQYKIAKTEINACKLLTNRVIHCIRDLYDERPELERDKWHAQFIAGVKLSAAIKRQKPTMSFELIPVYYKESVKRYMKSLIYRRSWSFCTELLVYIRYFYQSFYNHGYQDGFQENLTRFDAEKYLGWVAEDYEHNNATFRSKAVSFIRNWLDFIQLAEFEEAPKKDITRLIFEEDIPKRERSTDTLEKIKYIPEPVRMELDTAIDEIEPAEMKPIYILLRETGWRGTDILNLRYHQCLDYVWTSHNQEYIPYLYDEITKTGIPIHKIPIRPEIAEMVRKLVDEAEEKSTNDNNPDKYLFNTYEGKNKGLPYSKPDFASSVLKLINKKEIMDGNGGLYHFKTHSLRHTRAMEYTEQGMPIGIIQQILGHCSLQMTLYYSKVSEDMLYKKWNETEKLNLFKVDVVPSNPMYQEKEEVHYEDVRKNLDAVRVPFGVCFKPTKIGCKTQTKMCLECSSFCSTRDDLPAYDEEIKRVRAQISIGMKFERIEWTEKNEEYLKILEAMKNRILQEGLIHKNGKLRED